MDGLLSPRFWVQTIASTLITMVLIVAIKKVSEKYNIPVIKTLSENV